MKRYMVKQKKTLINKNQFKIDLLKTLELVNN